MTLFSRIASAALVPLLFVTPVAHGYAATDKEAVTQTIKKFVDSLGTNDFKSASAAFSAQLTITDEFPPYHWVGTGAFTKWGTDFGINSASRKVTEPIMTFTGIRHVMVSGDHAYGIAYATYVFKADGKPEKEIGALVFALEKTGDSWKINSMTWALK